MKKLIALFLVLAMCFSMFAACGQEATPTNPPETQAPTQAATQPNDEVIEDLSDPEGLAAALEYLRTIYKNAGGLSPKDYTRVGSVPVGVKKFEVVWTASVGEDLVKAVRGDDGMVTIDVNEECDTETPYTLTATLTDEAGNSVSYSWEHILPAVLSVQDILDQAYALESGASLPYECTLTGVITSIDTLWSDQYGNITVTIAMEGHEDRPVQCYRLAGDGAKDLAVGDTITVTGTITNYKGLIEFAQGCGLDTVISGGGEAPAPKEYQRIALLENGDQVVIYNPKYMKALSAKKTSYYNVGVDVKMEDGKLTGFGTTEVWNVVRHSNGNYSFVNANGDKMALDKEFSNLNADSSYDDWSILMAGGGKYMLRNTKRADYFLEWYDKYGNYSTYNSAAPEEDKQFLFKFYVLTAEEIPGEEEKPSTNMVPEAVEAPEAGVAYKFTLFQNGLEQLLSFTGKMAGYYYETSDNAADAVDVYLESADGGYSVYFMDGEAKTYLNVIPRDGAAGKVNVVLQTVETNAAPTVYTLNTEYKYLTTDCEGKTWYLGTYGKNSTISASEIKYIADPAVIGVSQFTAWFTTLVEAEVKDPAADSTLTVADAIALGASKEHNTYTEGKYYVTGEITEVYNTTYGNMYIKDAEGNTLTVYGTYNADGTVRYDAMEVKPVAGDTVTVYGIIGQYNDNPQMKNGWIVVHTPAGGEEGGEEGDEVVGDPAADSTLTIAEALALGASKEHNTYTEGKYYVTGEITEVYNEKFGNMYIKDAEGNTLTVYGTYNADGTVRYDAMEVKPVAGDTVTVYGIIGQYNDNPQLKNGWIVAHTPAAGGEEGGEEEAPVAYKFGMTQGNLDNAVYYLAGGMDGYYMATTTDVNAAIDVYLEETEGGFYFYTLADDGSKLYINMVVNGTYVNAAYEATASTVYTYNAEQKTLIANVNGEDYWFGTRNDKTYTTMGPVKVAYNGFYGQLYN